MRRWLQRLLGLLVLGIFVAPATTRADDSSSSDFVEDERLLQDARIATDGPGLLEFFHKRILTTAEIERIDVLVKRLGDNEFKNRVQGTTDLKDIGTAALPKLRLALQSKDAEVRRRAAEIIDFIQSDTRSDQVGAAARLLETTAEWRRPSVAQLLALRGGFAGRRRSIGNVISFGRSSWSSGAGCGSRFALPVAGPTRCGSAVGRMGRDAGATPDREELAP